MHQREFAPVNDFYAWKGNLSASIPGELLRAEPLTEDLMIPGAARGFRILYVSEGHAGTLIAVSGLLYIPRGDAPDGGWPFISYAHGTTGIIPAAAPSLRPNANILEHPVLGTVPGLLEAGIAVVCTDYEGLGTAGPHPYLHGVSLSNTQIDAARAARQVSSELSGLWIAMGQSEGGLCTLFTAAYASTRAPELDYLGAVSTAPPTEWKTLVAATTDFGRILTPLIIHAASYHDSSVNAGEWLNDDGNTLREAWLSSFLHDPGNVLPVFAGLIGRPLLARAEGETTDAEASRRLAATAGLSGLEAPRDALDRPILIAEGGADEFCVPGTVARLAEELHFNGSEVEFHLYPDTGHLDVPATAFPDVLAFVQRVFAAAMC